MQQTLEKISYSADPFLTIITRCYKRPTGLGANLRSVNKLTFSREQIFITDNIGLGLLEANRSFSNPAVLEQIKGEYVFLLDDDDFIVNPQMIEDLKAVGDYDIIFFRMTIKNGQNNNHYPTDELCWGKEPIIARIGGSCMVVKTEWYKKYAHNFGVARCGDFYMLKAMWNDGPKVYWLDKIMSETGSVGRGKPE